MGNSQFCNNLSLILNIMAASARLFSMLFIIILALNSHQNQVKMIKLSDFWRLFPYQNHSKWPPLCPILLRNSYFWWVRKFFIIIVCYWSYAQDIVLQHIGRKKYILQYFFQNHKKSEIFPLTCMLFYPPKWNRTEPYSYSLLS